METVTIENESLRLTAATTGAELTGVYHKKSARQMIWQAHPGVWGRHAPLLFPYCGRLWGNEMLAKGHRYPAPQHGFAKDLPFVCTSQSKTELRFLLVSGEGTEMYFPYAFSLEVIFSLAGEMVVQTAVVTNTATEEMLPFALGFHPGFALPVAQGAGTDAHVVRFEQPELPLEVLTPGGYVSGEEKPRFQNQQCVPLADDLFKEDSICLKNLKSRFVTLQQKRGGSYVRVWIQNYPYTLLWGAPQGPLPFVCIEPWLALPDSAGRSGEFVDKPGLVRLAPGGRYQTELRMEFHA